MKKVEKVGTKKVERVESKKSKSSDKKSSTKELVSKAKSLRKEVRENEDIEVLLADRISKSSEREQYEEYEHMFQNLKVAIRTFEKELKYSRSTKNVYALVALYSQQRELIADIRAISDYTENVNRILTGIIQPLFNDITQSNLDIFYHIRKLIIETCRDDQTQYTLKRLEDLMREQARYLQNKYEATSTKLVDVVANGK